MRVLSILGLALRRLHRRPVRSFLLLQATIWGVAVAIFPAAVIDGTRAAAEVEGVSLGVDRIVIAADPTSASAVTLDAADAAFLRTRLEGAGLEVVATGAVRINAELAPARPAAASGAPAVTVLEATPRCGAARGLALAAGRWLSAADDDRRCVVESAVGRALGQRRVAPGDVIRIGGVDREVVGVLAPRSAQALRTSDMGFDLEHPMYETVAQKFLLAMGMPIVLDDGWKRTDACVYLPASEGTFEWLYVRVGQGQTSEAAAVVRKSMVERDKTVLTLYPVVLPLLAGGKVERFEAVNIAMFLACLVMGAVVMANLGLLNVLSRSREIAIRRVEGATKRDVAAHFLGEGLILSVIGAALGCVLGMGLAELRASLEPVSGFTWIFPVGLALIASGVAILIGLLASLLPALRAAHQEPVVGLADD